VTVAEQVLPRGVYDGEEAKLYDFNESRPRFIVDDLVRPPLAAGGRVVLMGEEWPTAEAMCRVCDLLHGWATGSGRPYAAGSRSGLWIRPSRSLRARALGTLCRFPLDPAPSSAAIACNYVHPLSGGLEGRRQAGFPVEPLERVSSVNDKPTSRS
jgi:hypothetical protein